MSWWTSALSRSWGRGCSSDVCVCVCVIVCVRVCVRGGYMYNNYIEKNLAATMYGKPNSDITITEIKVCHARHFIMGEGSKCCQCDI